MSEIEAVEVPWSKAIVMICTKCSKKITGNEDIADEFKKNLKGSLKETVGKSVRVVTSSCLDVCPKNSMAVAVATRNAGTHTFVVDPKIKPDVLLEKILKITAP